MYNINDGLKEKIIYLNEVLWEKYKDVLSLDKSFFRKFIKKNVGPIIKLKKFSTEELKFFVEKGGILGVDGSNNRMGGAYPHYVEIYQGLAKSTIYEAWASISKSIPSAVPLSVICLHRPNTSFSLPSLTSSTLVWLMSVCSITKSG